MDATQSERYSRHLLLPQIGEDGQRRLNAARVLIIGLGGLGSPVAMYLAASGVGHLVLVDFDHVELSNLQRQIIHATSDIGRLGARGRRARRRDRQSRCRGGRHRQLRNPL
jgi:adenylyltransferase/sulfurtransferase